MLCTGFKIQRTKENSFSRILGEFLLIQILFFFLIRHYPGPSLCQAFFLLTFHSRCRVVSAEGPLFDQPFYSVTLPENKRVGSPVTRVEAQSPSGNDVIYNLVAGNTYGHFDLDYETGRRPSILFWGAFMD